MNSELKRHPILTTEWIRADGMRQIESRVYCDVHRHAVPVGTCRKCPYCIAEESSEVRCSPSAELLGTTEPSAGSTLSRGAVVVDKSVLVRDVVALFAERKLRMLVIADPSGRAQGVVHESRLVREIQDAALAHQTLRLGWEATAIQPISCLTSAPVTVVETVPLREALVKMASAQQRQLLVVDEQGFPIGLLFDVDALPSSQPREGKWRC